MNINRSDNFKFFSIIFTVGVGAVTLMLSTKGIHSALVLSIGIGIILFFTKKLWLPEGYGKYKVRLASLSVGLAVALSFGFWQGAVESVAIFLFERQWPELAEKFSVREVSPYVVLGFIITIIWLVNYFNRDKTAMGVHPKPLLKISSKEHTKKH